MADAPRDVNLEHVHWSATAVLDAAMIERFISFLGVGSVMGPFWEKCETDR